MRFFVFLALALAAAAETVGCAPATPGCDDAGFRRLRAEGRAPAEVTVCGTVVRVRPARTTRSGVHAYFILDVGDRRPVEVVLNESELGAVPVRAGDRAEVRGRYFADAPGRDGIDWTHHGTSARWPYPGYVVIDGTRYQ